jgi:O-antigen/teichoic acid export membrane protein
MAGVRRALLFNAGERYICLAISFLMIFAISRLLTPTEIGLSVIGIGIMTLALALREFASSEFLIQREEVTRLDIRTAFTILFLLYGVIAAVLVPLAPWLATAYGEPGLSLYMYLIIAAGLLDTLSMPIMALLRRNMAFDLIAVINIVVAVAGAGTTIALAALGFGFMSFAWAWLASSIATSLLALYFRPYWWMFVPTLASWRSTLNFGGYNGATTALQRFYEALPQLVLGRILSPDVVAFYNRSGMVVGLPDRIILAGIFSVAFPAFATEVRQGNNVKGAYLQALSHITVLHWPALLLLTVLAHPTVMVLMGQQWTGIVPLVQMMAMACLFWFPMVLTQPVLVAMGALHDNFMAKLISISVCTVVLCGASFFSIEAMAASQFFTIPFQMIVALFFVRRHIPFGWGEVARAVWKSAVVSAFCLLGPLAIIALNGFQMPLADAIDACLLSALGWAVGLWLTRHPFLAELSSLVRAARRSGAVQRLCRTVQRRAGHLLRAYVG